MTTLDERCTEAAKAANDAQAEWSDARAVFGKKSLQAASAERAYLKALDYANECQRATRFSYS